MPFPDWLKHNASTILTGLGAGGFIFTVVEAVRATPKAMKKLEEKNPRNLKEKITTAAPCYIPTAAVGLASLGCIIGANVVGRKENEALTAMLIPLQVGLDKYKDKLEKIVGPQARIAVDKAVKDEENGVPWYDIRTYYYKCVSAEIPIIFDATAEEIASFEYEINRKFATEGFLTERELLDFMPIDHRSLEVLMAKEKMEQMMDEQPPYGWDHYIDEAVFGSRWIDVSHHEFETDDGYKVIELTFPVPAHPLDEPSWMS